MARISKLCLQLVDEGNALAATQILQASDDGRKVELRCFDGPLVDKIYAGVDYFWLLSELRKDLMQKKLRPLVMGAKKDVFVGGLAGETSMGFVAYIFDELGEGVGTVKIFDPVNISEADKVVFFDEQKAYRKALIQKRRKRRI